MRKLASLLAVLLLFAAVAFGQDRLITGQITDDKGVPIPFASVLIKGTSKGVVADENGFYKINASTGDVLVVTATGAASTQVTVGAGNNVTINMQKTGTLDEVVVTALGVKREKKALGFAQQSVSGDNLTFSNGVDVSSALAGKVAGVKLYGSPSSTFDNASIVIRGPKGLGLNAPLFVLDGNIVGQETVNMENIEDVSVLKGGTATALYGQRAAYGVVMLTSKKGKRGAGTSVEVKTGVSFEKISMIPDYQNEYAGGYSSAANSPGAAHTDDAGWYKFHFDPTIHPAEWASWDGQNILEYGADESWGPRIDGVTQYRPWYSWYQGDPRFAKLEAITPQPNNVKDFFKTGRTISNSVAMTSNGSNYNVRLSYNNQDRTLVQYNTKRMLHQIGVNGSYDVSRKVSFSSDVVFTYDDRLGQPFETYRNDGLNILQGFNQWFQRQLDVKSMRNNMYSPDGRVNSWNIGDPNGTGDLIAITTPQYWDNPWFVATTSYQTAKTQRLSANIGINAELLKGLKWNAYVRRYSNIGNSDNRIATGGLQQDYYGTSQYQNSEMNYETNLLYKNKFGDFSIDGQVGMNIRKNREEGLGMNTNGGLTVPNYFNINASKDRAAYSNFLERRQVWSHYARASVGYRGYLFLEGTIRRDQVSTLPESKNAYVYPSAALSFVFSDLLKSSSVGEWLSFGKVRVGLAQVGTDVNFAEVNTALSAGAPFAGTPSVTYGNTLRNGDIKPALQTGYELGLEMKVLNKFGLDFTYYNNKNENQIMNVAIPGATGFSAVQINAGKIVNKGWELVLTSNLVKGRNFAWDASFNISKTSNKLMELARGLQSFLYSTTWNDTRVEHRVGQEWGVLIGRKWDIDPKNGLPVIGTNGTQTYTTGNVVGNILPDFTGGFVNSLRYKFVDLSFSIDYQKGGLFFSTTRMFATGTGLAAETVGLNDKGNDIRSFPSLGGGIKVVGSDGNGNERIVYVNARRYYYTNAQRDISNFLYDATYVKMREIRLGLTAPAQLAQKIKAKGAHLSFFVSNPWLIYAESKDFGIDPSELETTWNEGGQLSQTRQIGASLKLTF